MADSLDPHVQRLERDLIDLRATVDADRRRILKLQDELDSCRAAMLGVLRQVPESFLPNDSFLSGQLDDEDLSEN
jgi:hypothetical protein